MKHLPCTGLDPVNNPLRQVSLSSPFSAEDTRAKRGKYLPRAGSATLASYLQLWLLTCFQVDPKM